MGEKQGGGMDYGVDEPTSSLDDSRSTSMVGAREGLARRMETDANIRDLNARIPDVQPARVAFNNQPISGDFFVNRVSRGLQNLFGGGDGGDRDTTRSSPSANRFQSGLASLMGGTPEYGMSPGAMGGRAERDTVPDFVRVGGGTAPLPARPQTLGAPRPSAFNINNFEAGRPGMDDL